MPPFINARYAAQLEHLREVYPLKQKAPENAPGTAALKDGLARLEKKAEAKKTPSHNKRPGYFTYLRRLKKRAHVGPLASSL